MSIEIAPKWPRQSGCYQSTSLATQCRIDLVSGVSALLAWFPARLPQEVTIQCPNREAAGAQRDDGDQMLQAIKFTDKKVPGLHLDLDEDFQTAGCFTEVIRGYKMGLWSRMSCAAFSQQERPESRLTSLSRLPQV